MVTVVKPNTWSTLVTDINNFKILDVGQFFDWLYERLEKIKREREAFFGAGTRSAWVRYARPVLAGLAVVTFLLTTFATYAVSVPAGNRFDGDEEWALPIAMGIYTVIAAIVLYDQLSDVSTSYFRHIVVRIAIRNLWSSLQITFLKEYPKLVESTADVAVKEEARQRLCDLAKAFCDSLDALVAKEQSDFQVEFLDSLKELAAASKQGLADAKVQIDVNVAKAVESATKAQEAAERAEAASRSGALNITVTGQFDGDVVVSIDSVEQYRGPSRKFTIPSIAAGRRLVKAEAFHGSKVLETSETIEMQPSIQSYTIAFS